MTQVIALKVAWMLCAFLWAFVAIDRQWGFTVTLALSIAAVSLGASAAKNLGQIGAREWEDI